MSPTHVVVTYCEGWDTQACRAARPLKRLTARGRHETGGAYAVLLTVDGDPRVLLQIDRGAGHLGVYGFDAKGRRALELAYRDFGDHLRLRSLTARQHESADEPEFASAMTAAFEFKDGNRVRTWLDHRSRGRFESRATSPAEVTRIPPLEFGSWPVDARMLRESGPLDFAEAPDPADEGAELAAAPWSASRPAAPGALDALFTPGVRIRDEDGDLLQVLEPDEMGPLRLATGRVVAGDPFSTSLVGEYAREPFTVPVGPGEYPVDFARLRVEGEEWDLVPAVRIRVSAEPAATWEPALRPGQDERLLGSGEFFGFGADSGGGAFMDSAASADLVALQSAGQGERPDTPGVVAFATGSGEGAVYPVWIGRDGRGAVTSFVADLRMLGQNPEILPPATEPGTRTVRGVAELPADEGPAPLPFDSGAILAFIGVVVEQQSAERRAAGNDDGEWMEIMRRRSAQFRHEYVPQHPVM